MISTIKDDRIAADNEMCVLPDIGKWRQNLEAIQCAAVNRQARVDRYERLIKVLLTWLLDDEQKAALVDAPLNYYYLLASVYLHDVEYIVENHHALGILELSHAQVIAAIVRAANQSPEDWSRTRQLVKGDRPPAIHTGLIAAALAFAKRIDLHLPTTLKIIHHTVAGDAKLLSPAWPEWFYVDNSGPDPHQPGTVLIRINCRHAGLHYALKRYETSTEKFLGQLNRQIRPRFLFSKVRFEIRAEGYQPMEYKIRRG